MRVLFLFLFLATQSFAQDAQREMASQIETLAYSHPNPTVTLDSNAPADGQFLLREFGATMVVEKCMLRVESWTYPGNFEPYISQWAEIDLTTAKLTLSVDQTLFTFFPAGTMIGVPQAYGRFTFTPYPGTSFTLHTRHTTADGSLYRSTAEPQISYILLQDVTTQRLSRLTDAVTAYQRNYCQPIG